MKNRIQIPLIVCISISIISACDRSSKTFANLPGIAAYKNQTASNEEDRWPASFGFGRKATSAEIARQDIDVRPDGQGLPKGSGTVAAGQKIYLAKCSACHGKTGIEGPENKLVVREANESGKAKVIGNYWPYATTLYDYINRAMPFNAPGSLKPDEVYSLTAYLLYENRIIKENEVLSDKNLALISMPAKKLFVNDDRRGGSEIK